MSEISSSLNSHVALRIEGVRGVVDLQSSGHLVIRLLFAPRVGVRARVDKSDAVARLINAYVFPVLVHVFSHPRDAHVVSVAPFVHGVLGGVGVVHHLGVMVQAAGEGGKRLDFALVGRDGDASLVACFGDSGLVGLGSSGSHFEINAPDSIVEILVEVNRLRASICGELSHIILGNINGSSLSSIVVQIDFSGKVRAISPNRSSVYRPNVQLVVSYVSSIGYSAADNWSIHRVGASRPVLDLIFERANKFVITVHFHGGVHVDGEIVPDQRHVGRGSARVGLVTILDRDR